MSYNLTGVAAANTTLDLFKTVNTELTGGLLGNFMVLALGVILFLSLSYYSAKDAFLFTSFILAILTPLLWMVGIVQFAVMLFCVVLAMLAVIIHITT